MLISKCSHPGCDAPATFCTVDKDGAISGMHCLNCYNNITPKQMKNRYKDVHFEDLEPKRFSLEVHYQKENYTTSLGVYAPTKPWLPQILKQLWWTHDNIVDGEFLADKNEIEQIDQRPAKIFSRDDGYVTLLITETSKNTGKTTYWKKEYHVGNPEEEQTLYLYIWEPKQITEAEFEQIMFG